MPRASRRRARRPWTSVSSRCAPIGYSLRLEGLGRRGDRRTAQGDCLGHIINSARRGILLDPVRAARVQVDGPLALRASAPAAAITVLLIEDNAADARSVQQLLSRADGSFAVTPVRRVVDALVRLAIDDFDIILLDAGMLEAGVSEALDRMRTAAPGAPIVLLTGARDDALALRAMREGVQDFIVRGNHDGAGLGRSLRYAIERQRSHDTLREREARYALAAEGANDGLWDWNLRTDEVYFSPRWCGLLGLEASPVECGPGFWFSRVHEEDIGALRLDLDRHLAGETDHFSSDHRLRGKDGTYRWLRVRGVASRDQHGPLRIAGSLTDIHDQRRVAEESCSDPLTGLANGAVFKDRLGAAITRATRNPACGFAVLLCDIDGFKTINGGLGRSVGDDLLVTIAARLAALLGPADTVARLGGDEFAVLLDGCNDSGQADGVARRIHDQLNAPLRSGGHEVFVSISIGIVMSSQSHETPEECLRHADIAMYRAKASGTGGHAVFDLDMHHRAVERLQLENDLRRAVERREFQVHYQPIVALDTGDVWGFEALVRWEHPDRGLLMPDTFVPLAEETGLIIPIGWQVLDMACRQLASWQSVPGKTPFISVNISGLQIAQPDLHAQVNAVLHETGCAASDLRLELTETMRVESTDSGVRKLAALRDLDLRLCIDDFGTGYSSLTYLQRLPTHTLKIDRSFVRDIATKPEIVGIIMSLAKSVDMCVEAEGIETVDQLDCLRKLGCRSGQGFLFSKALPAADANAVVHTQFATR